MISAQIVADSKNTFGQRITTMKLVFPRIVLAEFNTHRALTRNSASSRAIPFKRMVKMVQENPFIPIAWQKEHKGMQGTEYFDKTESKDLEILWQQAADSAIAQAQLIHSAGITKQLANRLLEPFMYHTVLVTATEWDNFFALRAHPDAEIHIAKLAEEMLIAYNESTPKQLEVGEWHIPFGDNFDDELIHKLHHELYSDIDEVFSWTSTFIDLKVRIAIARCARLSYETLGDDPKIDYAADLRLFDQLLSAGHMSPFEHVARAMTQWEYDFSMIQTSMDLGTIYRTVEENGWCGNFRGFIQYRKMLQGENKVDSRIIKK